ncbi:MAG TPA: copper chaperone PCu(A)C [Rhizomicrobium sp.]|jgi:hypothetical protein
MSVKPFRSLLTLLVFCAASPVHAGQIAVEGAWFRALPAGLPAAGYFSLRNGGNSPVVLKSAQTPACAMLMLHQSSEAGGTSRMSDVSEVRVPAGGKVDFSPGGYHLMCTGPTAAMTPGRTVSVTLGFADGTSLQTAFAVKTAAGK